MRTFSALIGATLMLISGCSGSDDSRADVEASAAAFCAAVTEVELSSAGYGRLAEVTPEPLRADVERFAGFLADLEALDGAEADGGQEAITSDPEYRETLQRIGNYVTDECGIGGDGSSRSGSGAESPARDDAAPGGGALAPGSEGPGAEGPDGNDGDAGSVSRREEPAVPPEEVKAEMRERFGDRLWGTSHGYFAPDGSEYEGNVRDLTEGEALSACEDLSAFIAEHPDMEGQGVLRLTDITVNSDNEVVTNPIAVNDTIGAGDPGDCHPAE